MTLGEAVEGKDALVGANFAPEYAFPLFDRRGREGKTMLVIVIYIIILVHEFGM